MSEKHYPYIGGGFNRIIFDGDESVWVSEAENKKLQAELKAEHALAETLGHYHEAAKAENEKLRLLVLGLDYCSNRFKRQVSCERCPLYDVTDVNLEPKCVRMMRELKIDKEEI